MSWRAHAAHSIMRTTMPIAVLTIMASAAFARPALAQSLDVSPAITKPKIPTLGLSPEALNFGKVLVGATSPAQTVTVTNGSSTTAISITSIVASSPFIKDPGTTCGTSIAPSGKCTVDVSFKPTAASKKPLKESQGLAFTDSAQKSPQHVQLEGQGEAAPTPTPTATATKTATPTGTATATPTLTATPTMTATSSSSITPTPTTTATPSASPSPNVLNLYGPVLN